MHQLLRFLFTSPFTLHANKINFNGILLCNRFAYPPNSLSLCGPDRKNDLVHYSQSFRTDQGNVEILTRFSTLYPYLELIARSNNIKDPLDRKVVEAYWLGNMLLKKVKTRSFSIHLSDTLELKKKVVPKELNHSLSKLDQGALPNHAFHVTNIYRRTGHLDIPQTIQTMDACLINWGKVTKADHLSLTVQTQSLKTGPQGKLYFQNGIDRVLYWQGEKDKLKNTIKAGDFVSYHWGYVCHKLNRPQLSNLIYYNNLAINLTEIKN